MLLQRKQQQLGGALAPHARSTSSSRPQLGLSRPVASSSSSKKPAVAVPGAAARRSGLRVYAGAGVAFPPQNNEDSVGPSNSDSSSSNSMGPVRMAKGGMGGSLGGSATLERSKLSFVMPTPTVQPPKLDDGGDGGGIGKNIHNGGGGGDGDGGDDDDYFNEGDDDGDGDGQWGIGGRWSLLRAAIPEQYDSFSIGAVLAEWMRTIADLPAILRQAVTMGLFSSAQLVRFFAMDVRPTVTRAVTRRLPPSESRDFVGRLMADPGFVQKTVLESSIAACASLWYEYRARGERFKNELDLVMINTLGMAAATCATMWTVAPSRTFGSLHKSPLQQTLDGLPNCVFDASTPLRQYSLPARAGGFMAKLAELSAVGALTGGATSILSAAAVNLRQRANPEFQPSVGVPTLGHSSGGLAAYFAVNANTRYQLIGGLDRVLFAHTNYLWTYLMLSGGARFASQYVGEQTRPAWQGLPAPSSLAPVQIPRPAGLRLPRRIKKKVSKKVPKYQPVQPQQQPPVLQAAAGSDNAVAASMAATAAAPVPTHTPQLELAPLSGTDVQAATAAAAAVATSSSAQGEQQQQVHASTSGVHAASSSGQEQGVVGPSRAQDSQHLQPSHVHVAPASASETEDPSSYTAPHAASQHHSGPQYARQ